MKEGITKKESLTKSLTFKLALIIIAVLMLLAAVTYGVISKIVSDQTMLYNRTLADILLDSICTYSSNDEMPVDENYTETVNSLCEDLCWKNYVAYAFAYKVCEDKQHVTVLGLAERDGIGLIEKLPDNIIGNEMSYPPEADELELWEGKIQYIDYKSPFVDDSVATIYARDDDFGNRIVAGVGVASVAVGWDTMRNFIPIMLVIIAGFIVLTICIYFIIRRNVLNPAKKIGAFMTAFIKNGSRTKEQLDEAESYEFSIIASSFNKMTEDIDSYLDNIRQLNDAQARQQTEFAIASDIQQGFLAPNMFHAGDCEIYAMMIPARNVGGDLYDYFTLDDGRILLTIADVSGKGIAASMYMAVTLTFIRQLASNGCSPAEILRQTNNIISSNNKHMLFITAFVGIYDPESAEMTYSNAGHLPPYIIRSNPELLTGAKNLVLGLYTDEPYTEDKVTMDVGDIIFLYTDGVTEAINSNREFFGEERLKEVLDSFSASHEENIVEYVSGVLDDFTKDSEQFDDITMLSCTMKQRTELELSPDRKNFIKIKETILAGKLPRPLQLSLCVAAEEIFINICSYAFEGRPEDDEKKVRFVFEHSDRVVMRFEDNGIGYDPTKGVELDIDYDPDSQLGGLGRIIAFNIADKVSYEYIDNKNTLTITKYLMEG